jgi:hypothetical protein
LLTGRAEVDGDDLGCVAAGADAQAVAAKGTNTSKTPASALPVTTDLL